MCFTRVKNSLPVLYVDGACFSHGTGLAMCEGLQRKDIVTDEDVLYAQFQRASGLLSAVRRALKKESFFSVL